MQKCSLCGGKVVNGRCEDCGLPIPPEHTYTHCGESVHTHEVNGEKVLHRVRTGTDTNRYAPEDEGEPAARPARQSGAHRAEKRRTNAKSGKRKLIDTVLLLLFSFYIIVQLLMVFFS